MCPHLIVLLCFFLQIIYSTETTNPIAKARAEGKQISDEHCKLFMNNDPVKELMEKVCSHCHEYFSDTVPNLRFECRRNCFQNKQFESCLSLFDNNHRARRHVHRRSLPQ
ncbi:unnamed protein product, partial [Mesorhabditis belari]|uniref:Uncharacterized protein n=1 Tax=Mesorhabditis belari TaxID=2138241 RepID=A0AAF3FHD0_9BILA